MLSVDSDHEDVDTRDMSIAVYVLFVLVPDCQFIISHLGFRCGNFFLIAPCPDQCLHLP